MHAKINTSTPNMVGTIIVTTRDDIVVGWPVGLGVMEGLCPGEEPSVTFGRRVESGMSVTVRSAGEGLSVGVVVLAIICSSAVCK